MKKLSLAALICFASMFLSTPALCIPLDLSGFTADPSVTHTSDGGGVTESGGIVYFYEAENYVAIYFYNDFYNVENYDKTLSFDYDFTLGEFDYDDYLTFEIDFTPILDVFTNVTGGHFEYDMAPHRGQTISIAWGLIWDWDIDTGTSASVYNINLSTESYIIPEPATLLLTSIGLIGFAGIARKKLFYFFRSISLSSK